MCHVLFALRDYEERNGMLPGTLAELVPEFLNAPPKDWMDGGSIRYNAARGMLWSVGTNLTDEGGRPESSRDDCVRIPWVIPSGK